MNNDYKNINVLDLIPHKGDIVLVSGIYGFDQDDLFTTFYDCKTKGVFIENNRLKNVAFIENIAQSAAVYTSFMNNNSTPPKTGMIGAVSKLEISGILNCGQRLLTKIKVISKLDNAMVVQGVSFSQGVQIAKCKINLFLNN